MAAEAPDMGFPFQHSLIGTPPPLLSLAHRRVCWVKYVENVDPLLKILHKPTIEGLITVRDVQHYRSRPSTGALVQAICLLAVVSMTEKEASSRLDVDRATLIRFCAVRTEQSLMAANFLDARDLPCMQALLLYLYYLKYKEDSRLYGLRGVAIFLATRLGLNRDRVPSEVGPLEAELRRRLWWQLITLVDHPDDCATDYAPPSVGADTRLPLNVNDSDLEQQEAWADGREHRGFTESSFCLMQYEITRLFNQIRFERAHITEVSGLAVDGAEKRLDSSRQRMESQYFHDAVEVSPLGRFAQDAMAMILTKRRVLMHISPDLGSKNTPLSQYDHDHLFLLAIHVIELSRGLQTTRSFERWRWLSGTYFQWGVANFVVKDLATRSSNPATKRAWKAMTGILDDWPEPTRNSPKAAALKDLIANAARHRDGQNIWNMSRYIDSARSDVLSLPLETARHNMTTNEERQRKSPADWTDSIQPRQSPSPNQSTGLNDLLMPEFAPLDFETM